MTKDELEMMKRTNTPSHKMNMQFIIKNALTSKPPLTFSEFVTALQDRGINILFNQASTGYVSGISYDYKGMTFTGSKLGNDFKWTTIKNRIDYEQERDRALIHETNTRTKSLSAKAGATSEQMRASEQGKNLQQAYSEYAKLGKRSKQIDQFVKAEPKRSNESALKGIEGFSLATLLDGNSHGSLIHADHQTGIDPESVLGLKRKKKRRKRLGR